MNAALVMNGTQSVAANPTPRMATLPGDGRTADSSSLELQPPMLAWPPADLSPGICIAGMHRSGTSMVTRLLHAGGVHLGDEAMLKPAAEDNPQGFWEHESFVGINDELLSQFGGAWDCPPGWQEGWVNAAATTLQTRARKLLQTFTGHAIWGWKDPRNSLTLPFWKDCVPSLRMVLCVRNPLEVAASLHRRNGLSYQLGLALWRDYNRRALAAVPARERLVIHFEACFQDPRRELRRLLAFAGTTVTDEVVERGVTLLQAELRHGQFTSRQIRSAGVSPEVIELYARLCEEAGFEETGSATGGETTGDGPGVLSGGECVTMPAGEPVDGWAIEAEALRRGIHRMMEANHSLEQELVSRTAWGQQSHAEVEERDAVIRELKDALAAQLAAGRGTGSGSSEREEGSTEAVTHPGSASQETPDAAAGRKRYVEQLKVLQQQLKEETMINLQTKETLREREVTIGELRREASERNEVIRGLRGNLEDGVASRRETVRLEQTLHRQAEQLESLSSMLELLLQSGVGTQSPELRAQLLRRQFLQRFRHAVRRAVPVEAIVLVACEGDDELLELGGPVGRRFPQRRGGADDPPGDSLAAITQLEAQRAKGAGYLVVPGPASPWLDRYPGLKQHLERRYHLGPRNDAGLIFELSPTPISVGPTESGRLADLVAECEDRLGVEPSILDWNTGLELAASFPQRSIFAPPEKGAKLPYFDQSVDIVALSRDDPAALAEARRVAGAAVFRCKAPHDGERSVTAVMEWKPDRTIPTRGGASIIIPTYNGLGVLRDCLSSLHESLPAELSVEIIVADDGSTDSTMEYLRDWGETDPRLKVTRNERNAGFIATCNRGAQAATQEILIFLNNDTLMLPGWLPPLLRTFREWPHAGAVGGKLIFPDGRLQEAGGVIFADGSGANFGRGDFSPGAPLYNFVREVDYCSGALLATPRALFEQLGGFDTHYAPAYYEDTDYCFRVRQAGRRVYYQPESQIIHLEGATSGTDLTTGAKRYQVINHGKFLKRWKAALRDQPPSPGHFDFTVWHSLAERRDQWGGKVA